MRRGENAPNYGKENSIERCKNISKALSGRTCSEERKQAIAETLRQYYKDNPVPKRFGRTPKPILCVDTGIVYESIAEAARQLGIHNRQGISKAAKGMVYTCGGYHWKYYESSVS